MRLAITTFIGRFSNKLSDQERRNAGKKEFKTGGIVGYRKRGIQERRDSGLEGFRTGRIKEKRDKGKRDKGKER